MTGTGEQQKYWGKGRQSVAHGKKEGLSDETFWGHCEVTFGSLYEGVPMSGKESLPEGMEQILSRLAAPFDAYDIETAGQMQSDYHARRI